MARSRAHEAIGQEVNELAIFAMGIATPIVLLMGRDLIRNRRPKRCAWCGVKQTKSFKGGACGLCISRNANECGDAAPDGWPKS